VEIARGAHVDHQEHQERPTRGQRRAHATQHAIRIGLVVDRVESRDEIEGDRRRELRDIFSR
jgi:hypothetical protein